MPIVHEGGLGANLQIYIYLVKRAIKGSEVIFYIFSSSICSLFFQTPFDQATVRKIIAGKATGTQEKKINCTYILEWD